MIAAKRVLIILIISATVNFTISAQNEYYDALVLRKYSKLEGTSALLKLTKSNVNELGKLFRTYGISDSLTEKDVKGAIETLLRGNPFLELDPTSEQNTLDTKTLSLPSTSISSIGGLNVTNVADGLAKFLVERVKE